MAMNTKPRLYQRPAFNLIVAVVIGLCFGAGPGVAQSTDPSEVGAWSTGPTWPEFPVHAHALPTGKVMIWPGDWDIGQRSTILGSRESKRQPPYSAGLRRLLRRPLVPGRRKVICCGWPHPIWRWTGERKYL